MASAAFHFRKFSVRQDGVAHPLGADSVLLGAWATIPEGTRHCLDIGTGTGVLALMLAQRCPAPVRAVEIHPGSAACARGNATASPWADRVFVEEADIRTYAPAQVFDCIISNPPYFSERVFAPDADRRVARSTAAGLDFAALLEAVQRLLSARGQFSLILPLSEAQGFCELACTLGLYCNRWTSVRTLPHKAPERALLGLSRSPYAWEKNELLLFEAASVKTTEYAALVEAFF